MKGKIAKNLSGNNAPASLPDYAKPGVIPSTVGFRLRRVQLAYKRQFASIATDTGFQLHDVGALSLIARNPGVTPSALAVALTMDAGQVTNILKLLEARGLVSRKKCASDSRSRTVHLTDRGQVEYERLKTIIANVERTFVAEVLSEEETALLLDLLDRLGKAASARS